jgi:hypothetical protein
MKRCPKCNRTYTTDTQKFCTHDGGVLETPEMSLETVRIDTAQLDDDVPTKEISRSLVTEAVPKFDPFKTVVSQPEGAGAETPSDISPPPTPPPAVAPPAAPPPVAPQSAVPPPAAQASPSAPTVMLSGPDPIAASAPPPQPTLPLQAARQTQSIPPPQRPSVQPPAQPAVAPTARKKSKVPLVLGILVVLFIVGGGALGAAYYFVVRPMLARRVVAIDNPSPPTKAPTPNIIAAPDLPKNVMPAPRPYSPPADAAEFVNSKENLDGKLAEHYVDFSFYYPERWQKDQTAGVPGARNYVLVERRLPPNFTQENFAVAWNSSAAPVSENLAVFHTMAENLFAQFKANFPGYRKVSEGETKVGVYDGYEFRFEGLSKNTDKGDLKLWGRVIFLPPPDGGKDGVTLLMLATSLAPELKSLDDVGVKGELPMMLASFRFGKK